VMWAKLAERQPIFGHAVGGIVGVASRAPLGQSDLLSRMRDTMAHRGPDDAGTWVSDDRKLLLPMMSLRVWCPND